MTVPYLNTSTKLITQLHAQASLKPISLLDCDDFSNWGKLGLLLAMLYYVISSSFCIYWYASHISIEEHLIIYILLFTIPWSFRYMIDVLLKMYKKNLEYEFKNLPSPKKLLKVINGILKFTEKEGITRDAISIFISENLRDEIQIGKTTINKWFAMSNDVLKNKI